MKSPPPWMTALEMQFSALKNSLRIRDWDRESPDAPPIELWKVAHDSAMFLKRAQAFAWERDAQTAATMASRTIPNSTSFSQTLLPDGLRACFWAFDQPVPVFANGISALLCCSYDNGDLLLTPFVTLETGVVPCGQLIAPKNATLSAINADAEWENKLIRWAELLRVFLACCVWLQQRIVTMSSGPIERHRRKQLAREHGAVVSDVKVIQLRRVESQPRSPNADAEPVDWSCRWIVNGHWRNQPYKDGEHKLIYILPYVKGPDDKPLKVPTHTVYAVNR